ncbi:MAG: transposase [Alphaproteobacteria bacterium]|nr:transposase [Alphaproteobacteria bacterium]
MVNQGTKVNTDFAERERRFLERFPDDRACLDHLLELRFGARGKCPKCARTAKFHKIRQIPAYACQWCGYHMHPMAQTSFARSRVGLHLWFRVVFLYSNGQNGITARQLQRLLGLTYKTAWRMRNTIINVKFNMPQAGKKDGAPDFDTLLDALTTVKQPPEPDRPRRRRAA